MTARMPVLFIGHGSPTNALADNDYTKAWADLGARLPRPKAILAISAHWYTRGIGVTAMEHPQTIHDFGGFPKPLYEIQYPAPGDPALARRVGELLAPSPVVQDQSWGLDHGTWSVLVHTYPKADIPVVQLSIDGTLPAHAHTEIGQRLKPLRDEGILIAGFGNVVHNLRTFARGEAVIYDWAQRFEDQVRANIEAHDGAALEDFQSSEDARRSVPTPDHYLPLLYALGARDRDDAVAFPTLGIDGGSISMLSVCFGL